MSNESSSSGTGTANNKKVQFAKMFGENADKFKNNRGYFVSFLERISGSNDHVMILDEASNAVVVDCAEYACKHDSSVIERSFPETRLERLFAESESLLESDLLTYHTR